MDRKRWRIFFLLLMGFNGATILKSWIVGIAGRDV